MVSRRHFVTGAAAIMTTGAAGAGLMLANRKPQPENAIRSVEINRLSGNPIITPASSPSIGDLIAGPSVIRVPDWIPNPLGRYYLYFAHHGGLYIRLAYSDSLEGPWTVYDPGTLYLSQAPAFWEHIASPDVHVDHDRKQIVMYFHGRVVARGEDRNQWTGVAVSENGIDFKASDEVLGLYTFRVFQYDNFHYAIAKARGLDGGRLYRSRDPLSPFKELRPILPLMRRSAVLVRDGVLVVFYSLIGDAPESILASTVRLTPDWRDWRFSKPIPILTPQMPYEGSEFPIMPSERGRAVDVNQVRDPYVFEDSDGRTYLFYSVAGEAGIAVAEVSFTLAEAEET